MKLASLALAAMLGHCRPIDGCSPGTTRCAGDIAEICDADRTYQELADCSRATSASGRRFVCGLAESTDVEGSGHTCVPAKDDEGTAR